ncbi:unnamed protein product [Amoebophrya sp. A25]|nr:unnamed protein product [Amoebophrya sp. A25]|eukprot:GSA25T00007777001.1
MFHSTLSLYVCKSKRLCVRLVSAAQTGYHYTTSKSPLKSEYRIALRKYDPIVNQHVMFYESKLPVWKRQVKRAIEMRYARHTGERNKELIMKLTKGDRRREEQKNEKGTFG